MSLALRRAQFLLARGGYSGNSQDAFGGCGLGFGKASTHGNAGMGGGFKGQEVTPGKMTAFDMADFLEKHNPCSEQRYFPPGAYGSSDAEDIRDQQRKREQERNSGIDERGFPIYKGERSRITGEPLKNLKEFLQEWNENPVELGERKVKSFDPKILRTSSLPDEYYYKAETVAEMRRKTMVSTAKVLGGVAGAAVLVAVGYVAFVTNNYAPS